MKKQKKMKKLSAEEQRIVDIQELAKQLPHGTKKKIALELSTTPGYVTQVLSDGTHTSPLANSIVQLAQAIVDAKKMEPDANDRALAKKILA